MSKPEKPSERHHPKTVPNTSATNLSAAKTKPLEVSPVTLAMDQTPSSTINPNAGTKSPSSKIVVDPDTKAENPSFLMPPTRTTSDKKTILLNRRSDPSLDSPLSVKYEDGEHIILNNNDIAEPKDEAPHPFHKRRLTESDESPSKPKLAKLTATVSFKNGEFSVTVEQDIETHPKRTEEG